jgi:hypothetical protein
MQQVEKVLITVQVVAEPILELVVWVHTKVLLLQQVLAVLESS